MAPTLKIMYVDDEVDIRCIVEFALEDEVGMELRLCASGQEALDLAPTFRPDLILLDVMIPVMDGPTTLQRLRQLPGLAQTPVAFVTAKVQPTEVAYLTSIGAIDVIAKPFDPMRLPEQIRALWKRTQQSPTEAGGRAAKLAALRAAYSSALLERLSAMRACRQALAAQPASSEAHADLARHAHALAGSAGAFGYHFLAIRAVELEDTLRRLAANGDAASSPFLARLGPLLDSLHSLAKDGPDTPLQIVGGSYVTPTVDAEAENRVLLIEDDALLAQDMADQLRSFGWEATVCTREEEALTLRAHPRPAAAIVDLMMPEGPYAGLELMREVRNRAGINVPHLVLSARGDWDARLAAIRSGAAAYLTKPVDVATLAIQLDRIVHPPAAAPYRVLLVDDDVTLAEHYAQVLGGAGMEVLALSHPKGLLDAMATQPEIVLLDLYLPECSGIEALQIIRQQTQFEGVPVVFLSTEAGLAMHQEALQSGAEDFLVKPISDANLVWAVAVRAQRFRSLAALIRQDGLTGLLNQIAFKLQLEAEVDRSRRHGHSLSVAMLDIDAFKRVNDAYGHPQGDRVIKSLAQMLRKRLCKSDIIGRYGGEEFIVAMPDTPAKQALSIMASLCADFGRVRFETMDGEFKCAFCGGVASQPPLATAASLIDAADHALYQAKTSGRNRIVEFVKAD